MTGEVMGAREHFDQTAATLISEADYNTQVSNNVLLLQGINFIQTANFSKEFFISAKK